MAPDLPGGGRAQQVRLDSGDEATDGHPVHAARWQPAAGRRGPPIIAVHGLAGSHLNWASLAPLLAERVPTSGLWAPDLSGLGRTPPLPAGSAMEAQLALLEGFVRTVAGEGPVRLVGNSMGGALALLLADRRPRLVDGLVLIAPSSPVPIGRLHDRKVALQFAATVTPVLGPRLLARHAERHSAEETVRDFLALCGVEVDELDDQLSSEHVRLTAEHRELPHAKAALVEATRSLIILMTVRRWALRRAARRVAAPVLVIQGAQDRLISLRQSTELAGRRGSWTLRVYSEHGHVPMLAEPERVAEDICAWVAEELGPSP